MKTVFNFLKKLFGFGGNNKIVEPVKVWKVEDEETVADNMIKNNQEKLYPWAQEFDHELPKTTIDIPKNEIVFDKKVDESQSVKVKKTRRILTYKIETKQGLILFEGEKISKFIEESSKNLSLGFTKKQVYMFALKYQDTRIFKDKYFVSFKEVEK